MNRFRLRMTPYRARNIKAPALFLNRAGERKGEFFLDPLSSRVQRRHPMAVSCASLASLTLGRRHLGVASFSAGRRAVAAEGASAPIAKLEPRRLSLIRRKELGLPAGPPGSNFNAGWKLFAPTLAQWVRPEVMVSVKHLFGSTFTRTASRSVLRLHPQ